ncbi:MAG TPA: serine/threonine-protein kinase [Gemmatimonadales bacterium]|nr:serine/threonine-protein kinase [Gemmatimonadales bacterium]
MKPLSDAAIAHLARATDWPDLSGTRYTALEELGQGGMGTVFRARDALLGREVALKVLRSADAPRDFAERLEREAGVLARLEHPGIVPVHDRGVLADGRAWYVMKLVRGRRLDAWLGEKPSLRERLDLVRRVAETVGFAHARGVVHRDLKPANIMVGEFGEVLVLDWGLAKIVSASQRLIVSESQGVPDNRDDETMRRRDDETGHGTVLGTPGFMAPEQQRGDVSQVDQRTDVYGLGALLRAMVAPLPKALESVASRATAADRALRYPDATSFAEDIRMFQDGDPVTAHNEGTFERLERIVGRYRTPILLVLVYLLLRALFIIFSDR